MQNYKEINGNDYVKDSRTTINETMRSIQSMNSGTSFPTANLFEGMKCYRTDLKKTYTLTDVENNTWAEDDTASKLATARKINITGNATGGAAFDGSSDISINTTVNESKHAAAADNADKLGGYPLNTSATGGNWGTVPKVGTDGVMEIGKYIDWHATSGDTEDYSSRWTAETDGTVSVGTINGTLNGNADTATKLATARAISLTGNASGSANFDGSEDVSINVTVNESKHAAAADTATTADNSNKLGGYPLNTEAVGGQYGTVPFINDDGVMEIGKYIDWHATSGDTEDYSSRWTAETDGTVSVGTINGTLNGNADSATNADKLDGYHASDIINKISAANTGGIVAASLTENGYAKFANGLILQWGTTKYGGKGHEQHNYPIAFPNAVFSITGALSDGGSGGANWSVGIVNNTTYYIFTDESSLLSWMAIGY